MRKKALGVILLLTLFFVVGCGNTQNNNTNQDKDLPIGIVKEFRLLNLKKQLL